MKKQVTDVVINVIKFVGDEHVLSTQRCYTKHQVKKACYVAVLPVEILDRSIDVILEAEIACFNPVLGVYESVMFSKEFSGNSLLNYAEFVGKFADHLDAEYTLPGKTKTNGVPRKIKMSADLLRKKVALGRHHFPLKGKTMKKRPPYYQLRMTFDGLEHDYDMFIEHYSTRFKVTKTTAMMWYQLMQAVCFNRIPKHSEWPGNEVMLKHFRDETPYKYLMNKYRVSRSVLVVWFEYIKEVLLYYPETPVKVL